jgi:hypothetical protein
MSYMRGKEGAKAISPSPCTLLLFLLLPYNPRIMLPNWRFMAGIRVPEFGQELR